MLRSILLLVSHFCSLDALLQNFTYPWFLALQECPDYHGSTSTIADCKHFCTAVVLSEDQKLVMLPAHCLFKRTVNPGWQQNIHFVVGEWHERKWKILFMKSGPTYFRKWLTDDYKSVGDISIVQLDTWYNGLRELPRATKDFYLVPYVSNCTGFGNNPGENSYLQRQRVKLTIVPQDRCEHEWGSLARNDSKICTINKSGGECPGDSGTILVCDDPEDPGEYKLVGMSALGPNYCGTDVISGLFTNVLTYESWIDSVIHGHSKSSKRSRN